MLFVPVLKFIDHLDVFRTQLGDMFVLFDHQLLISLFLVDQLSLKCLCLVHNHAAKTLVFSVGTHQVIILPREMVIMLLLHFKLPLEVSVP